jgi:hypothetical protein
MRALLTLACVITGCAAFTDADYQIVDDGTDAGPSGSSALGAKNDTPVVGGGAGANAASGGDSDDEATTGGSDGTTVTVLDPNDLACGESFPPTDIECPEVCNGGCAANTCNIHCNEEASCKDGDLKCPHGLNCTIVCAGKDSCEKASMACADGYACSIVCNAENSCKNASLLCGVQGGDCSLLCQHAKACEGTQLSCGAGDCRVGCAELRKLPTIACGNACNCRSANCGIDDEEQDGDD